VKAQLLVEALPATAVIWGMFMRAMRDIKVTVTVERRQ
jgi:hypothetical protein